MNLQDLSSYQNLNVIVVVSKAIGICSILLGITHACMSFRKKRNGWKFLLLGFGGFALMKCLRLWYAVVYLDETTTGGTASAIFNL